MIIVLDASAAIEIVLSRESSRRFRDILSDADLVIAPDTFPSEVTNVFWKYGMFSDMDGETCGKGLEYCLDLVDDYIDTKDVCKEVLFESMNNEHSAYDLFYLIVARRHSAALMTKDAKLIDIAEKLKIAVT